MASELFMLDWPLEDRASLAQFAEAMAGLRRRVQAISGEAGGVPVPRLPRIPSARECAGVILRRRLDLRRMAGDQADLLGDPAWEMLLALFQAGHPMTEAALLDMIGMTPQGLAGSRWIALLVDRDWLVRGDAGLQLGAAGSVLLDRYFAGF